MYETNQEKERVGPGPGCYQTWSYIPCSWEEAHKIVESLNKKK